MNDFFCFSKKIWFLGILGPPGNHASRWIRYLWSKGVSLILAYLKSFRVFGDFFCLSKKKCFFVYSWSTLLWHLCYYPHRSRDALSPVCGIFCMPIKLNNIYICVYIGAFINFLLLVSNRSFFECFGLLLVQLQFLFKLCMPPVNGEHYF